MSLRELVYRNRSYRRFDQGKAVSMRTLDQLVDLTRLAPSAGNLQPLKYFLSTDPATNALIFDTLAWAAYLKDWSGPEDGERPAAYVVMLGDGDVAGKIICDHGIAAQTIMLGSVEKGLGGCILASVDRKKLKSALSIPEGLDVLLVLALGVPAEEVRVEPMPGDGSVKYWRDGSNVHHVPKRSLDELVVSRYPGA